jgi:hypothetical protein
MIQRCTNIHSKNFHRYGGRGINVCEQWRKFEPFLRDVGIRPSRLHTLERIDNGKGYEPGNVRWATQREQMFNTRRTYIITAFGKTASLAEFFENSICQEYDRAHYRIGAGWDTERAILAPAYASRNP